MTDELINTNDSSLMEVGSVATNEIKTVYGRYSLQPSGAFDLKMYQRSEILPYLEEHGWQRKQGHKSFHGLGFNASLIEFDGKICIVKSSDELLSVRQSVSLREIGGDIMQVVAGYSRKREFLKAYPTTQRPLDIMIRLCNGMFELVLPDTQQPNHFKSLEQQWNKMIELNAQINDIEKQLEPMKQERQRLIIEFGFQWNEKMREYIPHSPPQLVK